MNYSTAQVAELLDLQPDKVRKIAKNYNITQHDKKFDDDQVSIIKYVTDMRKFNRIELIKKIMELEDELIKAKKITFFDV